MLSIKFLFIYSLIYQVVSFHVVPNIPNSKVSLHGNPYKRMSSPLSLAMKTEKSEHGWEKKGMAALLGTLFFLNTPDISHALQSGGRSGGSSFRSSGSTRSYSSGGRGGGGYSSFSSPTIRTGPSINVMPMYSPFGYGGGFGFSPFGFSPFGFIPLNLNVIILAGAAYLVYNALSNRMGGADFSSGVGSSGSVDCASVVKLTVSLDANWGDDRNIMSQLTNLASRYNAMTERSDLSKLLSETSLALLRSKGDWNSASYKGDTFRESSFQKAESSFQQLAIQERAKFDEENSSESSSAALNLIKPSNRFDGKVSLPTQAVVSIVVALRGQNEVAKLGKVQSNTDVMRVLEQLASAALVDEGENVMALEVLWSPSAKGVTLTERDLIMDYPELLKL